MNLLSSLFGMGPKTDFKQLFEEGAVIVDVRSPGEFASGHIDGSINIPLDKVKNKVKDLKKMNKPIITCCLSGGRSGAAMNILKAEGLEVHNGGGWASLNSRIK